MGLRGGVRCVRHPHHFRIGRRARKSRRLALRYYERGGEDKGKAASDNLHNWLVQAREILDSGETDAVDIMDEFRLKANSDALNLPAGGH